MVPDIPKKVELLFWNHAIPEMTENQKLRSLIQKSPLGPGSERSSGVKLFYGIVAFSGLIFGMLAFHLIHPG